MRRLGLLLGSCGAILGGLSAYNDAQTLWAAWTAHRKFESAMALPTIQRLTNDRWAEYQTRTAPVTLPADFFEKQRSSDIAVGKKVKAKYPGSYDDLSDEDLGRRVRKKFPHGFDSTNSKASAWFEMHAPKREADDWETVAEGDGHGGMWILPAHPLLKGNSDGVERVRFDRAKRVVGVILSQGEALSRTDLPDFGAYLVLLAYPLLGFLVPWGSFRILTWVGRGFFQSPPH